jgi:hypothetical protein
MVIISGLLGKVKRQGTSSPEEVSLKIKKEEGRKYEGE